MKKKIVDFLITKITEIRVSLSEHEHDYVFFPYIADDGDDNEALWAPGSLPMSYAAWDSFLQSKLLPAIEESRTPENTGEHLFELTFSRKIWRQLFSLIYRSDREPDDNIYLFEVSEASDIGVDIINEANELIKLIKVQEEDNRSVREAKSDARREIVVIRLDKDGNII